jgi:DNA-binding transcriptional ArsR family regulator
MVKIKFPLPPPPDDEEPTPESTRDELLGDQTRKGAPIRSAFLQERGGARAPGSLHHFVRERRLFALQLYLLLHCLALGEPWDKTLPAATWARALDKAGSGAESTVSRNWRWLEDHHLVRTERDHRMVRAYLLSEDGGGDDYERSRDYFQLPLAFFRESWHRRLDLAGTAVLLICLEKSRHKEPWFQLRTASQSAWYGISAATLQRGLDELREAELLLVHPRQVRDSKARYGRTQVNDYLLLGSFARNDVLQVLLDQTQTNA